MGGKKDMSMMKLVVAASLILLLVLLIQNKIRAGVLFASLAVFYYLLGYLDYKSFVSSYTNDSLISLVLLLLVSIAVERTIFIQAVSKFIIGKNYLFSLLRLGILSSFISAFLNNTAVVASFMGVVKNNKFQAPSKLLIPLSYFAVVGGTLTLIGTSTNLIVNSFVIQNSLPPLKMFDFLPVGLLLTISMIITLMLFHKLLPQYTEQKQDIKEHLIVLKVLNTSSLIGKTVLQSKLRNLEFLFLVQINRAGSSIVPVSHNEIIQANDELVFSGDISHINSLKQFDGLEVFKDYKQSLTSLVDVVITPTSSLIGKKVKEANFRAKFDAAILSLQRGDSFIKKIGEEHLQAGDRLVLATGKDFVSRENLAKNFYLLSNIKQSNKLGNKQSFIVISAFLLSIISSALNLISFTKVLLLCLGFFLLFKFIKLDDIKRRFPFEIFIVVGSSLAITKVLVDSSLAKDLADLIIGVFGTYGVYGSFVGVYLLTLILTEFITNNAAAALAFPIAFATSQALGVSPLPFIFAVAYAASAGFMIPHSYQTHLMVNSLCPYKISDFLKIGFFVSIVYSAVVLLALPIFFKF